MQNLWPVVLLSALAALFAGHFEAAPKAVEMAVAFGTTKDHVPILTGLVTDYVADATTVVPNAVRRCGGSNVRYQPATDGAAVVAFTPTRPAWRTARCIRNRLPQVLVQNAASVEMPCSPPKAGHVCQLTQFWP